jgi:hypothetical protein
MTLEKFFKNGCQEKDFTESVYKSFYLDSNLFIAHFNKSSFYSARFGTHEKLLNTIEIINTSSPKNKTVKKMQKLIKENNKEVHKQIAEKLANEIKILTADLTALLVKAEKYK